MNDGHVKHIDNPTDNPTDNQSNSDICISSKNLKIVSKNKSTALSWEVFQTMGNPENAPDIADDVSQGISEKPKCVSPIRVYIERKGRKGKTVTLIKGLLADEMKLNELCKKLKSVCGVGGGIEDKDIMLQGDQRTKVIDRLVAWGYTDVKNAGM